jgi:hypothetical protein
MAINHIEHLIPDWKLNLMTFLYLGNILVAGYVSITSIFFQKFAKTYVWSDSAKPG